MALSRTLRLLRTRPRLGRAGRFGAVWLAAFAFGEVLGRQLASDAGDLLFALAFVALAVVTHAAHARNPIAWWGTGIATLARLRTHVTTLWGRVGADLRGGGDVRSGLPPPRLAVILALAGLVAVAALAAHRLPGALRLIGTHGSYTLYIVLLSALWAALVCEWMAFGYLAAGIVGDARIRSLDNRRVPRGGRSPSGWLTAALPVGTALLAASPLPPLVGLAGVAGCLVAVGFLGLLPRMQEVYVIWSAAGRPPCRAPMGLHLLSEFSVGVCTALLTGLVAAGHVLVTTTDVATMPVTTFLGRCTIWAAFFGLSAGACRLAGAAGAAYRAGPLRPVPRVVHLTRAPPPQTLTALTTDGWTVRVAPDLARPGDVGADPDERDLGDAAAGRWLQRRHELVQRRLLRRGLRRLLRAAARFRYERGAGFWIAPNLWFVPALARDEHEEDSTVKGTGATEQVLGPDHEHALPPSARRYAFEVLRALDVDLIFLEDGVGYRGLRRVFTVLYEVYDVHGGQRPVRERDFTGLLGLCVVLHDLDIENPFRSEQFPEPDYGEVSRARILHVFRDRGGEEERAEEPAPSELVPLLA